MGTNRPRGNYDEETIVVTNPNEQGVAVVLAKLRSVALDPRLLRFCVVGLLGYGVNSTVLFLLFQLLHMPLLLASSLAVETAIINNFIINNRWTFSADGFSWSRLLTFHIICAGGLVISVSALSMLVCGSINLSCSSHDGGGFYLLAANLLASCTAMAWNFFVNRRFTWNNTCGKDKR